MRLLNLRKLLRVGIQGSVVTASMLGILMLVFFANTLLKLENTEHVFFIFRLSIIIASVFVVKMMMKHKNGGELSASHNKSINRITLYLVIFYLVHESFINWGMN